MDWINQWLNIINNGLNFLVWWKAREFLD